MLLNRFILATLTHEALHIQMTPAEDRFNRDRGVS